MAVDKKSDHIGNHGGAYLDEEGMSRQFTYVDHDRKLPSRTSTGRETSETKETKENRIKELRKHIRDHNAMRIEEILAMPAVSFLKSGNTFAEDYIVRDVERGIIWDEKFTRNALLIKTDMIYIVWNAVWKYTVKEDYWFEEMSHEDILAGKWKEWI